MAETLVLANLQIDASGVASGINQSVRQMGIGERALQSFSSAGAAAATRMFSLRSAALVLARSLGVVGIVASLAFALKGLISDLITGTTWFKKIHEATTDWWNAISRGETIIDRTARKQKELFKGIGITSVSEQVAEFDRLQKARVDLIQRMSLVPKGPLLSGLQRDLFDLDKQIDATIVKLAALGQGAQSLGIFSGRLRGIAAKTGGPGIAGAVVDFSKMLAGVGGAEIVDPVKILEERIAAQKKLSSELEKEAIRLESIRRSLQEVFIEEQQFRQELLVLPGTEAEQFLARFDASMQALAPHMLIVAKAMGAINEAAKSFAFETWATAVEESRAKVEAISTAVAGIGGAIATSLLEGGRGLRQAIGNMLKDLARLYIVKAIENLALGIMASTPWGQAAGLGPPGPYYAAAKLWGVAAAFAGAASAAVGTGSSESEFGRSGGGGGLAGARGQTVTINVQGSIIGTDPDNLARDLARLLRTATSDGA